MVRAASALEFPSNNSSSKICTSTFEIGLTALSKNLVEDSESNDSGDDSASDYGEITDTPTLQTPVSDSTHATH